jgi:hypothetical protein
MFDSEFATPRKISEFTECKTVEAQSLVLKVLRIPHVIGARKNPIARSNDLNQKADIGPADIIPSCAEIRLLRSMPRHGVGIYFLCQDEKIVYVGKTTNFFIRMRNHALGEFEFSGVKFLPCAESRLDILEREYIVRFKPKYNVVHNKTSTLLSDSAQGSNT